MGERAAGLLPGCYLINNTSAPDEEIIRVTSDEYRAVIARGLARESHGLPKGYRIADVKRGLIAKINENNELVIEHKGTYHEQPRRSRDRYQHYSI